MGYLQLQCKTCDLKELALMLANKLYESDVFSWISISCLCVTFNTELESRHV